MGGIVAEARTRAEALRGRERELVHAAARVPTPARFEDALRTDSVGVIAEVKRRSPSKGWINADLAAVDQALAYERGGAAAISILTEPAHFGGSTDDLVAAVAALKVPVLKKDFHVDPIQLVEAKALGASAALLIARALSPDDLGRMMQVARSLDLEVLVEIRDEDELQRALDAGATVIGINNRNLETLVIDPATSARLLELIPAPLVAIAESGVSSRADVERVADRGADAVLVGSVISAAEDPAAAVRTLSGVRRIRRER
ncbi:MAG: Indole-3-glycerol phosphate synthase [Gemmatimonadetes bacterium]|nr:Indole-3-glycerol phosphate synthase [Gemmatimonadota bacterium]